MSDFVFHVAGVSFGNRQEIVKSMLVGDEVVIQHEKDNPYDKNALAVLDSKGRHMGYVPRSSQKMFKFLLGTDQGLPGIVEEVWIADDPTKNSGIAIKVVDV